jgi:hypothetical protein
MPSRTVPMFSNRSDTSHMIHSLMPFMRRHRARAGGDGPGGDAPSNHRYRAMPLTDSSISVLLAATAVSIP